MLLQTLVHLAADWDFPFVALQRMAALPSTGLSKVNEEAIVLFLNGLGRQTQHFAAATSGIGKESDDQLVPRPPSGLLDSIDFFPGEYF